MAEPLYFDTGGNERPRKDWDYHHVFPRCRAKSPGQKRWINLHGLVVPVFREFHNQGPESLHANVPHPIIPTKGIMYRVREHIYEHATDNPYDVLLGVNDLMHTIAETCAYTDTSKVAGRIATNLELQMPYILEGMVERVDVSQR